MKTKIALLLTGFAFGTPALAEIKIVNPWVRASTGPNSALFMEIKNTSDKPEKLIKVHANEAHHLELHTHVHKDGQMHMEEVDYIEVPGSGSKELKPGGYHVMLMKIKKSLEEGDLIPAVAIFESGEKVEFLAPVKAKAED